MPPQIHRGIVLRFLRQGASAATRRMNPLSGVAGETRAKTPVTLAKNKFAFLAYHSAPVNGCASYRASVYSSSSISSNGTRTFVPSSSWGLQRFLPPLFRPRFCLANRRRCPVNLEPRAQCREGTANLDSSRNVFIPKIHPFHYRVPCEAPHCSRPLQMHSRANHVGLPFRGSD